MVEIVGLVSEQEEKTISISLTLLLIHSPLKKTMLQMEECK